MRAIRRATPADSAGLARLLQELGYPVPEPVLRDKLQRLAPSAADAILVAERDGDPVACIGCHWLELLHEPGRLGRITALVVAEPQRSSGLGSTLIHAAEQFFQDHGCVRVEVTSGEHRTGAHAFYKSVGYEQVDRRFIKILPGHG